MSRCLLILKHSKRLPANLAQTRSSRACPRDTKPYLGTWFENGKELSGGEWQKIALARAFLREAEIIVLDEPTSSLDPLAEAELFRSFRELLNGKSAILISHRFSTVQMADFIYVLDQGHIIEKGTHSDLLELGSQYAEFYHAQASHYQNGIPHKHRYRYIIGRSILLQ